MGWDWAAGYVYQKTARQVKEAVQTAIESESQQILRFFPEPVFRFDDAYSFACVSPRVNDWTAFWYDSFWFVAKVFQTQKLTGMLMGATGKSMSPGDQHRCYWEYLIWHQGVIKHWFISNVDLRFEHSERFFNFLLIPYLQSRIVVEPKDIADPIIHVPIIRENHHLFAPDIKAIMPYVRSSVSLKDIQAWHSSTTAEALSIAPQILDIPFFGTNFNIRDISVFTQVGRGEIIPPVRLRYLEHNPEDPYERSPEWKNAVSQFELLFFATDEKGIDYNALHELFWQLL